MTTRKRPVRHTVKRHRRMGKIVESFVRGTGTASVKTPRKVTISQPETEKQFKKLLKKQIMQRKDEYGQPIRRGKGPPCPVCGRYGFDEFHVSDEDWAKYVPKEYQNTAICKTCYEKLRYQYRMNNNKEE